MSHPQEDWTIYSPDASDDYPPWKRRAINAFATLIVFIFLVSVVGAFWAMWTHLWIVPIIVAPLLGWSFVSWVKRP